MRRITIIAVLAAIAVLAFAGIAMAGTSPNYGSSNLAGASLKGTAVTHYNATYTDSFFGPVSCTGINQAKAKQPMQESFTCTSTSGLPLTNVSPGQTVNWGPGTWLSDSDHTSLDKTFTATVSADGMSYTAVATY